MKKASICEIGYWVSWSLFLVLCGLSISNSKNSGEISKLSIESIAPENLRTVPESFRLSLAVEQLSNEISDISTSDAWKKLQNKVSGYADRLELMEKQQRRQQDLLMAAYVTSAISMLVFQVLKRRDAHIERR